jgi:hypothetical protein
LPSNLLRSLRKRQAPSGPPFFQFSCRSIRYSRDELHDWMSERHMKAGESTVADRETCGPASRNRN